MKRCGIAEGAEDGDAVHILTTFTDKPAPNLDPHRRVLRICLPRYAPGDGQKSACGPVVIQSRSTWSLFVVMAALMLASHGRFVLLLYWMPVPGGAFNLDLHLQG